MEPPDDPRIAELERVTIEACHEVHRRLGSGLEPGVYEIALCQELRHRELSFQRRVPVPIFYRGVRMDAALRIDVCVAGKIAVDVIVAESISSPHRSALRTRLRLTGLPVGLAVNFRAESLARGLIVIRRTSRPPAREEAFDQTTSRMFQVAAG